MTGVSVIIPTYNRGPLLEEALASVTSQTYKDYEIIVADDGSTDDTLTRLERYGDRVKVLSLPRSGKPSVARNAAIAVATGKYVAFLDSDDGWAPAKLENQINLLERDPSFVMSYCDAAFLGENGDRLGLQSQREHLRSGWVFNHLLLGNFIPCPTVLVRRDVVLDVGGFEQWLTMSEDWHLWLKLSARGKVGLINAPLCQIRVHSRAITTDKMLLFADAVRVLDDIEKRFPEEFGKHRLNARRGRAKMLSMLARNHLFSGQTLEARRLFSRALASFPLRLDIIPFFLLALFGRRFVLTLRSFKKAVW
ncbi:MAG: glycosyltransferase [Candidatus Eisenbacteria bacterium]|nr:glycosyltransferase [Candidatus Eisenbacteria bacterium]